MQGQLWPTPPAASSPASKTAAPDAEKASRLAKPLAIEYGAAVPQAFDLQSYSSAFERSAFAYASLIRIASVLASIEPKVVQRGAPEVEAKGRAAEQVRTVLRKINKDQTRYDYLEAQLIYLGLTGEMLAEKSRNGLPGRQGRAVAELYSIDPQRVQPIPDKTGMRSVSGFVVMSGAGQFTLPIEDAIWTKHHHPNDDFRGLSPIAPMRREIASDMEAATHNLALLRNGVRNGGIVAPKEGYEWGPEQSAQLREQVESKHAGATNAGRLLIIPQAVNFYPDGQTVRDMDFVALRKLAREVIAGVWGTPPILIGNFDAASYANSSSQLKAFFDFVGWPLIAKVFGAHNEHWVHTDVSDEIEVVANRSQIDAMIDSEDSRTNRATKLFQAGVITLNEARRRVGESALSGGDILAMPLNMVPWSPDEDATEVLRDAQLEAQQGAADEEDGEPAADGDEDEEGEEKPRRAAAIIVPDRKLVVLRARSLVLHERALLEADRRIARAARTMLLDQRLRVESRLSEQGRSATADSLVPLEEDDAILDALDDVILSVIQDAGERTLDRLDIARAATDWDEEKAEGPELVIGFGLDNPRIADYVERHLVKQVRKINDFLRKSLKRVLGRSILAGENVGEMFGRIKRMPEFGTPRAELIARTESTGAVNLGTHDGFVQAGVERKSWLSSRDGNRVRLPHRKADRDSTRRPIRMEEAFPMTDARRGSTSCRWPGDPQAAVWAVAKCRCGLEPADEQVQRHWLEAVGEN